MVDQDFGHQHNSMSPPPLGLNPLGTKMTKVTTSPSDFIPAGTKLPEPMPLTLPTDSPTLLTDLLEKNEKRTYQGTRIQTHHCQTHCQRNIISQMTPIQVNQI